MDESSMQAESDMLRRLRNGEMFLLMSEAEAGRLDAEALDRAVEQYAREPDGFLARISDLLLSKYRYS